MRSLITVILLTTISCGLFIDEKEQIPADIVEFVNSQNLPDKQNVEIFLTIEKDQFIGFSVQYGEANDCPSGCFYSNATGFKLGNKIGWIDIQDYDENDISGLTNFEIEKSDSLLFTEEFGKQLEKSNPWIYRNVLLPKIASGSKTPQEVLIRIANGLYTYINPHLAGILLENTSVIENKEILEILSNLPVFQGDAYEQARERAKELLANLER
tara:strand:- start:8729 stop:9367 length:639 start_codon:yes stop_codon:yes gene_type:complete